MERENVQAWLQILSQNRKNLWTQVAQIKQTIEKFVEKYKSLGERICTLFHEHLVTIVPIFTALSMTILTIAVDITGAFIGRRGPNASGFSAIKHERILGKKKLADTIKNISEKAAEALLAILRGVAGTILRFLGNSVEPVAEHTFL